MVRTGLIGFGLAGRAFHASLIAADPRLELAAIATSRTEEVAATYPGARVTDVDALLADPAIDLVVVATPNDSHVPLARAGLAAGKHVVVDKPMAPDADAAAALVRDAAAADRLLVPFLNRRWDADFLTVAQLLAEDALGDVQLAELCWDRFRPAIKPGWREAPGPGAGLFADLGPHLLDQALVLFGWPDAVSADIACQRAEARVDDYFAVTLHHGSRRVVCASASVMAAQRPRFALHGTGGSFVKYGLDPQEPVLRGGGRPDDAGFGVEAADAWGRRTLPDGSAMPVRSITGDWRRFYAGVVAALLDGAPAPVPAGDAVNGLRLIELARRASETGCRQPAGTPAQPVPNAGK